MRLPVVLVVIESSFDVACRCRVFVRRGRQASRTVVVGFFIVVVDSFVPDVLVSFAFSVDHSWLSLVIFACNR